MDYFLKANGLVILLWLFYYLVLRDETFFKSIRIYFLLGLLIIISIPLIKIPIYVEKAAQNFNYNTLQGTTTNNIHMAPGIDWTQFLIFLYLAGVIFFSSKFVIQLFSLIKLLNKHKVIRQGHYKLVETETNSSPFSFFNYIIYYPKHFSEDELKLIIDHEKIHVNHWHSIDTILIHLLQIIFWFNPFAWLYKKTTQQNLEFLVDNYVFKKSKYQHAYQTLLLKTSVSNYQMVLTNNFYNSFLKKRILMLHTEKSAIQSQWKFVLILPLLMVFIFAFNTNTIAQQSKEDHKTIVKTVEIHAMILTKDSNSDALDKIRMSFEEKGLIVEFKGIKRNKDSEITAIKISAKADNGKTSAAYAADDNEGINSIKIEYDNKNNSLSIGSTDAKHMNGYAFSKKGKTKMIKQKGKGNSFVIISDEEDNEEHIATKVWITKDGDSSIVKTKKIIIEIEEDEEGEHDEEYEVIIEEDDNETENKFYIKTNSNEDPIYVVNGKEASKKEIDKIDPDDIKSINVYKGKKAEEKYGDKGKNGVVEITLKKE